MSLQTNTYKLGTNPHQDLHFIIEHYHFALPLTKEEPRLYELSLMLEELYQVTIESNLLDNLLFDDLVSLIERSLTRQKSLYKQKIKGNVLLLVGETDSAVGRKPMSTMSGYGVKIVLLTEHIPTWQRKYVTDFICCELTEHDCINTLQIYQENVGEFDAILTGSKAYLKLASKIQSIFTLPNWGLLEEVCK